VTATPIGAIPPPSALASTSTSGTTFSAVCAQSAPVRDARLHLVEHEQGAGPAAEGVRGLQIARRRQHDASLGLDGLDDEGGGPARRERLLQPREVAELDGGAGGQQRLERRPQARGAHDAERAEGQPVEAAATVDDAGTTGGGGRELERRVDRLGATRGEE